VICVEKKKKGGCWALEEERIGAQGYGASMLSQDVKDPL